MIIKENIIKTKHKCVDIEGKFFANEINIVLIEITKPYKYFTHILIDLEFDEIMSLNSNNTIPKIFEDTLINIYRKLSILELNWEKVVKNYKDKEQELLLIKNYIIDSKIKDRVSIKINDWFFKNILIGSNLNLTENDKIQINKAIIFYNKFNEFKFKNSNYLKIKKEYNSSIRWQIKNEILENFENVFEHLNKYLYIWKKTGGGTTGHAISSVIYKSKEINNFFKKHC